jgi:hypothetical protein
MKQIVIAILAIALIAGAAMADKPMRTNDPVQIDVNGGLSRQGGDEPSSAVPITALPFSDSGDTYDNTGYMGYQPDVFYTFSPTADTIVDIELCDSPITDTVLFVFDGAGNQIAYNHDFCDFRSAIYSLALAGGDTYLIAVVTLGRGDYVISVTEGTVPEPLSFCDMLSEAGSELSGDTCDGENLVYNLPNEYDFNQMGWEDYYEVSMPAGSSFTATVASEVDCILSVVAECEALPGQFTCLAYADMIEGTGGETISYTNDSGNDTSVFLVIDSWVDPWDGITCGATPAPSSPPAARCPPRP